MISPAARRFVEAAGRLVKELVESAGGRVRGDVNSRRDRVKPDARQLATINDDERHCSGSGR